MLFIIATPIGNLKDITFRAVETLKTCTLILAEDTRISSRLLKAFDIQTPMKSFHQFNEKKREEKILADLKSGEKIALISDAGTPGICDPGAKLITRCRCEKIPMQVLPGPCAFIAALSLYGTDKPFQFIGFLQKKEGELKKQLLTMLFYSGISIAYETPHHLIKTLTLLEKIAPKADVFLAKELTKLYENTLSGSPKELLEALQKKKIQGEWVLILPGCEENFKKEPRMLVKQLQETFEIPLKEAICIAAKQLSRPKREIYGNLHNCSFQS